MNTNRGMCFNTTRHRARRALIGVSVIGLGTLALLDNLHMFGGQLLSTYWPLVFVVWGLSRLLWSWHPGGRVFGVVLILLGGLMTAQGVMHERLSLHRWWPVFIILVGAAIALRGLFPRSHRRGRGRFENATVEQVDEIHVEASFSGLKLRNVSRNFKGGQIDCSFGGVEVDLREAVMAAPEVVLQIRGMFSGIELRVPRDWQVVVQLGATLGGVDDKTTPPMVPEHRLVLRGETVFGGVEIKN